MSKPKETDNQGVLVIVSAPSGCGKTTIVDRLLKRHPDWVRSISVTTREPRAGEKSGDDYYFVKDEIFSEMESKGELLESAQVFNCFYGTPKQFVEDQLGKGTKVILAIDVQGMQKIVKDYQDKITMLSIFVLPPSIKVLRERLEGRKTDAPEQIERRLSIAQKEINQANLYDCTVMNNQLEQTVLEVESLIEKFDKERRDKSHAIRST